MDPVVVGIVAGLGAYIAVVLHDIRAEVVRIRSRIEEDDS